MALTGTQGYKDFQNEAVIYKHAQRVLGLVNSLTGVKSDIASIAATVAADSNASAELKTLATQANNFVNNSTFTDFLSFVNNQLG